MINKNINSSVYFPSLIYTIEIPEWVDEINKICEEYIEDSIKNSKEILNNRIKRLNKNIEDHGYSYHSKNMVDDKRLEELEKYIGNVSYNILEGQGYDLSEYSLVFNDLWVQEFAKKAGGHHDTHVHGNNHISGFYFLKCSEKTSYPVFHDPRPGKTMSQLPQKKEEDITISSEKINIKPKPGTMIFFNSFMPHQYIVDHGVEPFRFIHFNLQAVKKTVL